MSHHANQINTTLDWVSFRSFMVSLSIRLDMHTNKLKQERRPTKPFYNSLVTISRISVEIENSFLQTGLL